jgi:hypothetical protein
MRMGDGPLVDAHHRPTDAAFAHFEVRRFEIEDGVAAKIDGGHEQEPLLLLREDQRRREYEHGHDKRGGGQGSAPVEFHGPHGVSPARL